MAVSEPKGSHFDGWQFNAPALPSIIAKNHEELGIVLPNDYVEFMSVNNGGEGFLGPNYLILWRVEDLVQFNLEYETSIYAPGLLLFGSNGGGEAFGFDTNDSAMPVVMVPFIGMDRRYARTVATTFSEFIATLQTTPVR